MGVWKREAMSFFLCENSHSFKIKRQQKDQIKFCPFCRTEKINQVKWKKKDL